MRPFNLTTPVLLTLYFAGICSGDPASKVAERLATQAADLATRGAFEASIEPWTAACSAWRKAGRPDKLGDALSQLGAACQALGRQRLAQAAFVESLQLARDGGDDSQIIAALSNLGALLSSSHHSEAGMTYLQDALLLARKTNHTQALAAVLTNLGRHELLQGEMAKSIDYYKEALSITDHAGDKLRAAVLRSNLADALMRSGAFDEASTLNTEAFNAAAAAAPSHAQVFCLLRVGRTWEKIFANSPMHDPQKRLDALHTYEKAAACGASISDDRALSYALGYTGHLYEEEGKLEEASRLTIRAAFLAQRLQSPDILYRWEWQTGRIANQQGHLDEAIESCHRAVTLLETIRTDLSSHLGAQPDKPSFRDTVGDAYSLLADLLLLRADRQSAPEEETALLTQARDVCEQLKTVELEDYFQDDCVNLVSKKRESVESLLAGNITNPSTKATSTPPGGHSITNTAVIYFIPLRNRLETIVTLPDGLHRVKSPVTSERLTAVVRSFREHLETRTTNEYLAEGWQLYDWLIRPLEPLLTGSHISTLVFVPDGALRTIPLAALHDGQKFLIEKYSVAVTPGLTLMEPHRMTRENTSVVASGLSEAFQGYPALPAVALELRQLDERFHGTTLLNRDFSTDSEQAAFKAREYSIVHIASHGEFNNDVRKTFVLTHDGHFDLDMLEKMIRPALLRDKPVEMLSLSACQTAAGDDRAALGLAGVAVKAGARSAFASLWCVNDEASAILISEFYSELVSSKNLSKAEALQSAQKKLLADPRYNHPCLWAPYLIIGNWL